jgi:hypothetical protein
MCNLKKIRCKEKEFSSAKITLSITKVILATIRGME